MNFVNKFEMSTHTNHFFYYRFIFENVLDKNPSSNNGLTPFHAAAQNGHLSVCMFIIAKTGDKNPPSVFNGFTPLHAAASNGHLVVCKLIMKNVDEKNPRTHSGKTPLSLAVKNRHFKTSNYIFLKMLVDMLIAPIN